MSSVPILAAAFGVVSHLGYFIHSEHDMQSLQILRAFITGPLLFFACRHYFKQDDSPLLAAKSTLVATLCYFTALTVSIMTYRVFFHPLRHFPGPFLARVSKITHFLRILPKLNNYVQTDLLHRKYGDIVRMGPNEITIINPDAIAAIHASTSKCTKSSWYDAIGAGNLSVLTVRDRGIHDKRRKIWDLAFSTKALGEYKLRLIPYVDKLVMQLDQHSGESVNASQWFGFYSFDVMGELAFGESFDLLKSGKGHYALKLLQDGMRPVGLITPIPWVLVILLSIPGAGKGSKTFIRYVEKQADHRRKNRPQVSDIASWLIDAEENSPDSMHKNAKWLNGDTGTIIGAGSDTTAATLTYLFYHLALKPDVVIKLREELQDCSPSDSKFLGGIINETLRLHPPVPSGVLRKTPPEGLHIGDTFIPGDVIISTPIWSLGRLESAFVNANNFIPERWTTSPELVKNKSAFIPFSYGPYACVGKQLALLSLRTVVSRLVQNFDFRLADGETGARLLNDTKDVFTLELAPLDLVFEKRLIS